MKRLRDVLRDLGVALLTGAAAAAGLLVLLLLGGLMFQGFQLRAGLAVARSGLLIVGSLALFVCAGLLIRPAKGEKVRDSAAWQKRFRVLGLMPVVAVVAVMLILAASGLDYYLYFI